jgi:hypothetical protein
MIQSLQVSSAISSSLGNCVAQSLAIIGLGRMETEFMKHILLLQVKSINLGEVAESSETEGRKIAWNAGVKACLGRAFKQRCGNTSTLFMPSCGSKQ